MKIYKNLHTLFFRSLRHRVFKNSPDMVFSFLITLARFFHPNMYANKHRFFGADRLASRWCFMCRCFVKLHSFFLFSVFCFACSWMNERNSAKTEHNHRNRAHCAHRLRHRETSINADVFASSPEREGEEEKKRINCGKYSTYKELNEHIRRWLRDRIARDSHHMATRNKKGNNNNRDEQNYTCTVWIVQHTYGFYLLHTTLFAAFLLLRLRNRICIYLYRFAK